MTRLGGTRRRIGLHREAGVAMVEFALVLPLLMMLVIGILDFGKAFNYWIDETHLANEAARWAAVNNNPGAGAGQSLQQYIQSQADTLELRTNSQVCISNPGSLGYTVGNPAQVTVAIHYAWLPFFPSRIAGFPTSSLVKGSAVMRLEAAGTNYNPAQNIGTCT